MYRWDDRRRIKGFNYVYIVLKIKTVTDAIGIGKLLLLLGVLNASVVKRLNWGDGDFRLMTSCLYR